MFIKDYSNIRGHLKIEEVDNIGNSKVVFDDHNVVTIEGKDHIISYLTNSIAGSLESIPSITAIALSTNGDKELDTDTWADNVSSSLSNSGILHSEDKGDGKQLNLESISKSNSFIIKGRIGYNEGNTEPTNIIRSCSVVFGASMESGYLIPYTPNGKEKILSRVSIGTLVKKEENAYVFTWSFFLT